MNSNTEIFYDAMMNNRIRVLYQPIFDADHLKVVSAEALCRIELPSGRILNPNTFIPDLEDSLAICDLDWYVAEEAALTLSEISEVRGNDIRISFNFSQQHAYEWDSVEKLTQIADKYCFIRDLLEVEITETYKVDSELLRLLMDSIRSEDFSIAIDDFGKGTNSLPMLEKIPFDTVKLDKSLIDSSGDNERTFKIVNSIIEMAHNLDSIVVAEGIEDVNQMVRMIESGCDLLQGNYFSKPLSKEKFMSLVTGKDYKEGRHFTMPGNKAS